MAGSPALGLMAIWSPRELTRTRAGGGPEARLVVLLALGRLTPDVMTEIHALLGDRLDWARVLAHARAEEVFPLVHRTLRALPLDGVPDRVRCELADDYRANAARNMLLGRELRRVLEDLDAAGVAVVPVKGIPLASELYGHPALRVCADIDVILPRRAISRALDVLAARGYRAEFTGRSFITTLLAHDIEVVLRRNDRHLQYLLELHWAVFRGPPFDDAAVDDLWDEARAHMVLGAPAYRPSAAWEFLFLAVHAARHAWALKWMIDLELLAARDDFDWEQVAGKAKRFGWLEILETTAAVGQTLFRSQNFTGRPREVPAWLPVFPEPASTSRIGSALLGLRLPVARRDRIRHLARVIFVPKTADRRFIRLPERLASLYYALRPLRLACKWTWLAVASLGRAPVRIVARRLSLSSSGSSRGPTSGRGIRPLAPSLDAGREMRGPGHRCPRCASTAVERTPHITVIEPLLLPFFGLRPYRCRDCWRRFYDRPRR